MSIWILHALTGSVTPEALILEEILILRVEGLDSLFIGAADLSRSIQSRADSTELKVVYKDICKRVREKGIFHKNFLFINCNIP